MVIPFVLQGGPPPRTASEEGPEYAYCPVSQVNVTSTGVPFTAVSNFFGPTMTQRSGGGAAEKDDD